jgi:hypothetical protein
MSRHSKVRHRTRQAVPRGMVERTLLLGRIDAVTTTQLNRFHRR